MASSQRTSTFIVQMPLIGPSHNTTTPNGTRTAFTDTASKGFQRLPSSRSEKQQHSVTFQDTEGGDFLSPSVGSMEKELKASLAKLYQNYDFVTDEYDRLFDIVDSMREDYNNTKSMLLYHRYHEYKRLIKNAIRKWSAVEKRSSLNISRKQSNTSFAQAINNSGSMSRMNLSTGMPGISEDGTTNYSSNLSVRLRANRDEATRELYAECTRLEREIFQYKTRNQQTKNILCKLATDYTSSKEHVLHIWGRYKELKQMIKEVINTDV